jgi:hypothetical protein
MLHYKSALSFVVVCIFCDKKADNNMYVLYSGIQRHVLFSVRLFTMRDLPTVAKHTTHSIASSRLSRAFTVDPFDSSLTKSLRSLTPL